MNINEGYSILEILSSTFIYLDPINMPIISVIMAIYNEPIAWIKASVESILNQTFKDFEFIIINDNPSRKENQLILEELKHQDSRLLTINNEQNIGLTKSLNKAISLCSGEFIARMDSDDISLPHRFRTQYNLLIASGAEICWSAFSTINRDGHIIKQYKNNPNLSQLVVFNVIAHPTVMFRRSILALRTPIYNELYKRSQDYELWTFLNIKHVKFVNSTNILLLYRQTENQITHLHAHEQLSCFKRIRMSYITNYLFDKNISLDISNLSQAIIDIDNYLNSHKQFDETLLNIRYLLYLNISRKRLIYVWRYISKPSLYCTIKSHIKILILNSIMRNKYPLFIL